MAGTTAGARKGARARVRNKLDRMQKEIFFAQSQVAASSSMPWGGKISLNRLDEEYVPALKDFTKRLETYDKMGNDAKIAAQLRASTFPLISAVRWRVVDGEQEHRDLIAANILREPGSDPALWCSTSWIHRLNEMMRSLKYGFSAFGKTWDTVGTYRILRHMTYLHPRSFGGPQGAWEWNDAGTRLVAVHRKYRLPNGRFVVDERIPVDDLFMVVWDLAGENWEGVSLLRSMYRSWVEKDMLARIGMIDAQNRGVGIPDVELSPTDTLADQRSLVEIAKSLRGGSKERAFVVRANGQKVGFLTSTGAVVDTASMIMQRNNDIASAASTDFMQQGQTQSGSRATGSVLMVSYMQELDATRQFLEEQINHGAGYLNGLIEDIMAANFPGAKKRPRIESSRVSPTEQLDNVPNILDAVQKGGLVHDLEVENHVRKALGVKELTQNEFDDLKTQNMPPNLGGRPSEVRDPTQDSSRDDEASSRFRTPSEKKTLVGRARPTNRASWDWLQSNGD